MDEAYIKEHYLFYIDILQAVVCFSKISQRLQKIRMLFHLVVHSAHQMAFVLLGFILAEYPKFSSGTRGRSVSFTISQNFSCSASISTTMRPLCMLKDVGAYRAIFNISLILPFVIASFFSPYG
ncbi:hypothetical protein AM501_16115 [Aneurinibacillus migulanus]|nr:hypothetical protein TS64_20015 [Aneurinibacillus migulanus]KPD07327.1 hypothetical protein AM501_16115 [Aneurinibacillus migulanus]